MKNKIFLIAVAIIGLMSSCEKQLDIDPKTSLSPETVGPADVQKLLAGVYDGLQEGNTSYFYLSYAVEDLSADNLAYRATFFQNGEIDNNAILANNVLTQRYFNAPYVVIQRANDLLEVLNNSTTIADATKKSLLTQAYFLRAYAYYKLVTLFGGVPIVSNRDVVKVPRKSVDEVYAQILSDLKLSVEAGGVSTDSKYASADAAKGLLARVYLIKKDYVNAKKFSDELIANPKYALSSDYNSVFAPPYNSSEHIFKVVFTQTEGSNSLSYFLQHPSMPGGGRAELPVDASLVAAYEPGDQRKAASMTQIVAPAANPGWYSRKYQDPAGAAAHPYYILRIAEMYLISAEAQFLTSNNATDPVALASINNVRTKRGLGALTSLTLQDIIKERRVEMAFENTRWMDMRRTPSPTNPAKSMATVFLEAKGRSINDEIYPIPQAAIDVNDLLKPNNPGY
jgi:starch-binding outer membrane protein, SusD/RagB family